MWEALAETSADDSHSLRVENITPRCVKISKITHLLQIISKNHTIFQPHFFEIQK